VTITIELSDEAEERLRAVAARQDKDALRQAIADAALPEIERLLQEANESDPLVQAIARLAARTPEEIARARSEARAALVPARPLPDGMTLLDAVGGKWPGDESDEEIAAALDRVS
jgi:hypothetical protein